MGTRPQVIRSDDAVTTDSRRQMLVAFYPADQVSDLSNESGRDWWRAVDHPGSGVQPICASPHRGITSPWASVAR